VIDGTIQTKEGFIIQPCDAVYSAQGGTAIHISRDGGQTWNDPGAGTPKPNFAEGQTGGTIAGIHAGVVQLANGNLFCLGRGDDIMSSDPSIGLRMPISISHNMGESWTYSASEFPPINGGQRLVLMRLREGPILLMSYTDSSAQRKHPKWPSVNGMIFHDAAGKERRGYGLFAALSFDEGKTWPVKKLITPGGPERKLDGGAWTDEFIIDDEHAEPMGYLAATQAPDGVIHLISSALHYRFNLAWLMEPMPAESSIR
jgi:hypothetical protein